MSGGTYIHQRYLLHYGPWLIVTLLHNLYVQTLLSALTIASVMKSCFRSGTLVTQAGKCDCCASSGDDVTNPVVCYLCFSNSLIC